MDLALNNLQELICHKTQPTNQREDYFKITYIQNDYNSCKILVGYAPCANWKFLPNCLTDLI